jgi:hypothetical protein
MSIKGALQRLKVKVEDEFVENEIRCFKVFGFMFGTKFAGDCVLSIRDQARMCDTSDKKRYQRFQNSMWLAIKGSVLVPLNAAAGLCVGIMLGEAFYIVITSTWLWIPSLAIFSFFIQIHKK